LETGGTRRDFQRSQQPERIESVAAANTAAKTPRAASWLSSSSPIENGVVPKGSYGSPATYVRRRIGAQL